MLKRIMIIASLGAALGFSATGYAQEPDPDVLKAVNALKQKLGTGWIIEWNEQKTGLKSIEKDLDVVIKQKGKRSLLASPSTVSGTPEDIAMAFLKENASLFQLPADLGDLRVKRVFDHGPIGNSVDIYQTFNGLPVIGLNGASNREIVVTMDSKKAIKSVYSNYLPNINISTTPLLSEHDAIAIAQEDMLKNRMVIVDKSGERRPISIEKQKEPFTERPQLKLVVYVTEKEEPFLVYSIDLNVDSRIFARYLIDANNGAILLAGDPSMYASGNGNIFWPNPVNTLNGITLTDEVGGTPDSKFAIPLAAYITKPLKDLLLVDNRYLLSGPYVRPDDRLEPPMFFAIETGISSQGTLISTKSDFFFDRETNQFEPVMVYQIIDTNQRYIQSLGIGDINKRQIKVDPHGFSGEDKSRYAFDGNGTGYLTFGEGGVDDAEDADIILHEYGHAIQDNQAPNKYVDPFCHTEAGAMAEGFGDYWQASNTRNVSKAHGFDPACYGEWDNADKGTMCRRRVDGTKRYADIKGDCHDDGEIWSSALWEILTKLGATEGKRKIADKLILQSHTEIRGMVAQNPTFIDGGIALLKADKTLIASGIFTTSHKKFICTALKTNRGILVPGC